MIDFKNVEKYKENNRIEAKRALGGLPHSIWETYSAFANALGGIILLGVEEHKDKSFHAIDLKNAENLIKEFWYIIKNTNKVSVNILSNKDVTVENIDGKRIIAIRVPRALRSDKPVYIDGNPFSGSYRRSGEGDYKCSQEEVEAMMRDAEIETQDMVVLENAKLDALDFESLKRYRSRMRACRPGHVWENLEDVEFLYKIGAMGRADDGRMYLTAAGLLMFGKKCEIVKEFPEYSLNYCEYSDNNTCETNCVLSCANHCIDSVISSASEDWSGNIFDFYFRVCDRITKGIDFSCSAEECDDNIKIRINQNAALPCKLEDFECENTPVHEALMEAVANCLINADYYGKQGIVIIKKKDVVTLSNPGGFRIDVEEAKSGGISDPRNGTLTKMFSLINVSKRTGSGIPKIFSVWKKQGWAAPKITEGFEPDRITISLPLRKMSDEKLLIKETIKRDGRCEKMKQYIQKQTIVTYLTEKISAEAVEIAELLGVGYDIAFRLLDEMVAEGTLVITKVKTVATDFENGNKAYKLKE